MSGRPMTMGEAFPHLLADPRYADFAATEAPEGMAPDRSGLVATGEAPPAYPGLLEMAGNLARATAAHVADGMRQATPATVAVREAACRSCPHYVAAEDRCEKCGCGLAIKRAWSSSSCPDDPPRWAAEP